MKAVRHQSCRAVFFVSGCPVTAEWFWHYWYIKWPKMNKINRIVKKNKEMFDFIKYCFIFVLKTLNKVI